MTDHEREEALKVEEPVQEKRGKPNQKTGLIGVFKKREKYLSTDQVRWQNKESRYICHKRTSWHGVRSICR